MFHDAFLVGMVQLDTKAKNPTESDRLITFRKTSKFVELKDTLGLPESMYIGEIKSNLEKLFSKKYDKSELTTNQVMEEIIQDTDFESVKKRGLELGSKLVENGLLDEAMNILKTHIGQNEDGSPKMFDTLIDTQIDLAKVVVMKLEELANKHKIAC